MCEECQARSEETLMSFKLSWQPIYLYDMNCPDWIVFRMLIRVCGVPRTEPLLICHPMVVSGGKRNMPSIGSIIVDYMECYVPPMDSNGCFPKILIDLTELGTTVFTREGYPV